MYLKKYIKHDEINQNDFSEEIELLVSAIALFVWFFN